MRPLLFAASFWIASTTPQPVEVAPVAAPQAAGVIQGRGAAGVMEVGRPLDVVRGRAEHLARERALADLASGVAQARGTPGDAEGAGKQVERLDARGDLGWEVRYWTNGSVSAVVTVAPLVTLAGMHAASGLWPGRLAAEGLTWPSVVGALVVVAGAMTTAIAARTVSGGPEPPNQPSA